MPPLADTTAMDLSVVIVNYNVRYFLEQALLSVRKAVTGLKAEVFVVDNASVDGSVEMVKSLFPEVQLIESKENLGFSKANNRAIRQAAGKYILLLNPDTVVEEDTFHKCFRFMEEHADAGALGVKMIDGSGRFLPESKRGFPSPKVAFFNIFGLSKIFPRSATFNYYHLGFLNENTNHEIDVLSGAFMWIRKEALDKSGLLDEHFFMYGEDIDLSYRLKQTGFKNFYLASTKIIHYKGESTKKGSLNYVRTFYQAMIIFARKHLKGPQAGMLIFLIRLGIYLRASITLLSNIFRKVFLPLMDALLLTVGLLWLKDFWASHYFNDPDYYQNSYISYNIAFYSCSWVLAIYFSGGYEKPFRLPGLIRGMFAGTLLIAAVYGFLDLSYRTSRILILLGFSWGMFSLISLRAIIHFLSFGTFNFSAKPNTNLIIVGGKEESRRVEGLLQQARVDRNIIGIVAPNEQIENRNSYLSTLSNLDDVVHIYKVQEIIFCSKDVRTDEILNWMTKLGPHVQYRIVPEESLSIIGSSSKNTSGELYTIDMRFRIDEPLNRRNKRLLDFFLSLIFLLTTPLLLFRLQKAGRLIQNCFNVVSGNLSWVGYADTPATANLPPLKKGVLTPLDGLAVDNLDATTTQRLNFFYAKDYQLADDVYLIWKGFNKLFR